MEKEERRICRKPGVFHVQNCSEKRSARLAQVVIVASLSSDYNTAIPSTMTTFFCVVGASVGSSLEVTAGGGGSFSIKRISAVLLEQCNIVPSAANSDL